MHSFPNRTKSYFGEISEYISVESFSNTPKLENFEWREIAVCVIVRLESFIENDSSLFLEIIYRLNYTFEHRSDRTVDRNDTHKKPNRDLIERQQIQRAFARTKTQSIFYFYRCRFQNLWL